MSTRLSFPSLVKKPTEVLSGFQKGSTADSVPGNGHTVSESRARSHIMDGLLETPSYTSIRPSGEMANEKRSEAGGVLMSTRNSGPGVTAGTWRIIHTAVAGTIAINTTAAIHLNGRFICRCGSVGFSISVVRAS